MKFKKNNLILLISIGIGSILGLAILNSFRQQDVTKSYNQGIKDFEDRNYERASDNFNLVVSNRSLVFPNPETANAFYFRCLAYRQIAKSSDNKDQNFIEANKNCTQAIDTLADRIPDVGLLLSTNPKHGSLVIKFIQTNSSAMGDKQLKIGDEITKIDNIKITEIGLTQAIEEIHRGAVGSEIKLTVIPPGGQESTHTLTRKLLPNKRKELAYYHRGLTRLDRLASPDYISAISDFDRAIDSTNNYEEYYLQRGRAKSRANQKQSAIIDLNTAISLNEDLAEAHYELGIIHKDRNTTELRKQAVKNFKRAIELNSKYLLAYQQLAGVQDDLGDKNGALSTLESAMKLVSSEDQNLNKIELYLVKGKILCNLGKKDIAITTFQESIEKSANVPRIMAKAYTGIAVCKDQFKDIRGALEAYSIAIRMDNRDPIAYFNRGVYLIDNTEDVDSAIKDFQTSISKKSDFADAYYYLGMSYAKINKKDEAIFNLQKASDLHLNSGQTEKYQTDQELLTQLQSK
jgi:tetratricopeptide (TPR) repeat protein